MAQMAVPAKTQRGIALQLIASADVIIRSEDGRLALPLEPDWRTPWW